MLLRELKVVLQIDDRDETYHAIDAPITMSSRFNGERLNKRDLRLLKRLLMKLGMGSSILEGVDEESGKRN